MHTRAGLFAAAFAALLLSDADAASYYVSADGSDSNSGSSADKPFQTPARAVSAMADGDSIFFRAGDRFVLSDVIEVAHSGSATNHIVIGAYQVDNGVVSHRVSTNRPILDGNKETPPLDTYAGLVHVTGRYVEVRDLVLQNSGGLGVRFQETADGWVENVKTDWTYFFGIQAFKSQNIQIKDCDVTGFGQGGKYYGRSAFPNGVSIRSSTKVTVKGCVVHEGWGEGINSYYGSRDVVIENNTVYAVRNVGIYIDSTQNADVRNNMVLGTADSLYHRYSDKPWMGPGIALNNEAYQYTDLSTSAIAKNIRIYNNLVAGTVNGLAFWGGHSATNWQDVVVVNNTFVDNETQIWLRDTTYTNTTIANNIFLSLSPGTSDLGGAIDEAGIQWRNNYWSQGQPSGSAASDGDIYEGLVLRKMAGWLDIHSYKDVSWEDFMPMGGSTTIGAGTDSLLSIVATDFSGKTRVIPPDLGGLQAGATQTRKPKAPASFSSKPLD